MYVRACCNAASEYIQSTRLACNGLRDQWQAACVLVLRFIPLCPFPWPLCKGGEPLWFNVCT